MAAADLRRASCVPRCDRDCGGCATGDPRGEFRTPVSCHVTGDKETDHQAAEDMSMLMTRVRGTPVQPALMTGLPVVPARAPEARAQTAPADLVLTNGRVVTVDEATPEAQAIA